MSDSRLKTSSLFDRTISVVMVVAAGFMIWTVSFQSEPAARQALPSKELAIPQEPLPFGSAALLGSDTAVVGVVEFSDFECPYCERYANDSFHKLKAKYIDTGSVRYAFKHLPLAIHPNAERAASAAECAKKEGKFWEMHARLFASPRDLTEAGLAAGARAIGVPSDSFKGCMGGKADAQVGLDRELADRLGLSGTPAFFVGTIEKNTVRVSVTLRGNRPLVEFEKAIDKLLPAIPEK